MTPPAPRPGALEYAVGPPPHVGHEADTPQVRQAVNLTGAAVVELVAVADVLEERLLVAGVLRPSNSPPSIAAAGEVPDRAPLAGELDALADRVSETTGRIRDLLARFEL